MSKIPIYSRQRRAGSGQALIEFALVIPLLFLLILNVVNFGGRLYAWVTVSNAARAGAQYMMMGPATIFGPAPPTSDQVSALVQQDLIVLPNHATATVTVCMNVSGTITPSGCAAPEDPEVSNLPGGKTAVNYVAGSVIVSYSYTPLIAAWDFSKLGIHLTIPSTTIKRKAVFRM